VKKVSHHIEFEHYDVSELSDSVFQLVKLARDARDNAYAVYSGFYVGASLELENGENVTGNNQENRAYPSGLCAERVAMFSASALYPGVAFTQMAIAVRSAHGDVLQPVSPCGACRQVMAEYELKFDHPIVIWLVGNNDTVIRVSAVSDLLPLMFTGEGVRLG
jgi:cytidine deaminase